MSTQSHYDSWSSQYDSNENKTRDLEAIALREMLAHIPFHTVLEMGCGTGKNTAWLAAQAGSVRGVDFSSEMLARAREKITAPHVQFVQANILQPWTFGQGVYDLVTFSLVLEHIQDLEPVFAEVARALVPGGHVYVGEFHPFRQYQGKKASYPTEEGEQELQCYVHHVSDFVEAGERHGLSLVTIRELFDEGDRGGVPRVLGMRMRKGG